MRNFEVVYAAAYRQSDLRPMTTDEGARLEQWRGLDGRLPGSAGAVPMQVLDGQVVHGPEHAMAGEVTLCGIAASEIHVARHLFQPETRFACAGCAYAAQTGRAV
ncbi:hypothetical protein ACWKSP_30150 [Micromonosporaceae bacterium Da 78-11]